MGASQCICKTTSPDKCKLVATKTQKHDCICSQSLLRNCKSIHNCTCKENNPINCKYNNLHHDCVCRDFYIDNCRRKIPAYCDCICDLGLRKKCKKMANEIHNCSCHISSKKCIAPDTVSSYHKCVCNTFQNYCRATIHLIINN